ncbi:MAG TPA: hypothetical protein G4O02_07770 [Caldilineae bacterium]|nr:hypothetical protein [Caldilineae bacterium]
MEQGTRLPDVQLSDLDTAELTPLVRRALDSETATITDWQQERVSSGVGLGTTVYRLTGHAQDNGQVIPWSLILKIQLPIPGQDDPSHWFYWKREAEAYRSGWLDDLPGGIAAPRCYGIEERPDGSYWLWLEEVKDSIGRKWPLEHYGIVARHLGQFNGAYLVGEPMPTYPWLSRDGIRKHVESSAQAIEQLRDVLDHPLVSRWLPGDASEQLFQTWAERDVFLEALDRLPQTICQFDAFRRNLFARQAPDGAMQTVIVDWSYTGCGPLGAELVPLVIGTLIFFEVDLAELSDLDRLAFEGYLEGLQEAGWHGDPRLVRLGYTAGILRYVLGTVGEILPAILADRRDAAQQVFAVPPEVLLDQWAAQRRALFSLLSEARRLIEEKDT